MEADNSGKRSINSSDVEPNSRAAAKYFYQRLGLRSGDMVHVALPNTTSYFYPVFGAWLCRAVVSLGDPTLNPEVTASQIEETKAKFIVCCQQNLERTLEARKIAGKADSAKVIVVGKGAEADESSGVLLFDAMLEEGSKLDWAAGPPQVTNFTLDELLYIIWSSGTTGRPKGIQLSAKMVSMLFKGSFNTPGDWLSTTCFFHGGGFLGPIGRLVNNSRVLFFPPEALEGHTENIFKAVDRFKPQMLMAGSHHIMRMAALNTDEVPAGLDYSSVNVIIPAGSNVAEDTLERLSPFFPNIVAIGNVYGQTEFGGLISASLTVHNIGAIVKGVKVKIVGPDSEEPLGPNEVGEIMAKGKSNMLGYLNRPEENAKFFGQDGFIHTGDYGHYDEEGLLYFDGRMKDTIKVENKHIHPIEIEDVILKYPGVGQCSVFGTPDPLYQEAVTAAVIMKTGAKATPEEIIRFTNDRVESFKQLRGGVVFMDTFPTNQQGKVLRRELRTMVQAK